MDKNQLEFYNGTNVFILPNGDIYLGEYCAHVSGKIWKEGKGVYQSKDGQFYEGEWRDDKLIDGTEVTITYADKSVFNGSLLKNKYNGSGCYTFANGIKVFINCSANIPFGEVKLADIDGRLWHGIVVGNRVNFSPENIFFQNIDPIRGISKQITKDITPEWKPTPETSEEVISDRITDKELEKLIFSRDTKVDDQIDFTDSDWYRSFAEYKNNREVILEKVKNHESLDKAEAAWYVNYAKYKKIKKNRKLFVKESKEVDTSLLDTFFSKEFAERWKGYSTFHPSYNWRLPPESESNLSVEEQRSASVCVEDEDEESIEVKEEVKEEERAEDVSTTSSPCSVGVGTGSLYSLMDAIAGKRKLKSCKWDMDVETQEQKSNNNKQSVLKL